jgi:hypothetical protein
MQNLRKSILKLISKSTFISFILLSGCAQWIPGMTQMMDDYITDDAVSVTVHKQAMHKDTDLNLQVQVVNK